MTTPSTASSIPDQTVTVVIGERSVCADITALLNSELTTKDESLQYQLQLTNCVSQSLTDISHKVFELWKYDIIKVNRVKTCADPVCCNLGNDLTDNPHNTTTTRVIHESSFTNSGLDCTIPPWLKLIQIFITFQGYSYKIDVDFDESSLYGSASVAGTKTFTFDSNGALTTSDLSLTGTTDYNVYNLKFRLYTDPASSYDKTVGVRPIQVNAWIYLY